MDGLIAYVLSKKYADAVGEKVAREGFRVEVESDRSILETIGQEKVFYFLPKDTSKPEDGYDEFIWTSDQGWEQVGVTDVDLSAYALKATTLAGYGITDGQTTIDSSHKLSSDLVDDTHNTNKFVTTADKSAWNAKYDKPNTGIPKTDLANDVQTSLDKADTALQHETYTGTVTGITMNGESKGTSGIVDLGTVVTSCDGSVTGDAVTFVKSVSISGHTLTGTAQAADTTIDGNSISIPTSSAVKRYADTTFGYGITMRLTNTTSGGFTQNIEFIPSQAFNLTSTWDSLWNVDHTATGTGTLIWTLNGNEIYRQTDVAQGALSFNIMPYLTPSATHTAVQKIIDAEQNERTLTYTITTTAEIPMYRVDFYVNSVLEQTSYVKSGQSVKWLGGTISVPGKYFDGWDKPLTNITEDTVITAKLSELALPAAPVDVSQYDYVWTNNPEYTSAYSWGELLAICNTNNYLDYISIGDVIRVELNASSIPDVTFRFRFVGYNHYKLAGTNQFAHTCWSIADGTDIGAPMNSGNTNVGGFPTSRMRTVTFPSIYSALPDVIVTSIPTLEYPRLNGNSTETTTMVEYPLYNETAADLGLYTVAPYSYEVDSGADSVSFPYYVSNATRVKKLSLGTGIAVNYWTGTPVLQSSTTFWFVGTSGAGSNHIANILLQRRFRLLPWQRLISFNLLRNCRAKVPAYGAVRAEYELCEYSA